MADWSDVPAAEQGLIKDLGDQWLALSGYSLSNRLSDDLLHNMAKAGVADLSVFSHYMWNFIAPSERDAMPWVGYGMSQSSFTAKLNSFQEVFRKLLGRDIEIGDWANAQGGDMDIIMGMLGSTSDWSHPSSAATAGEMEEWMMHSDKLQQRYGWLKFGMTWDNFQQQKLGMRAGFGKDLSDEEAVTQLRYLHSSQGGGAQAIMHQQQQQQPGFTGTSVVR